MPGMEVFIILPARPPASYSPKPKVAFRPIHVRSTKSATNEAGLCMKGQRPESGVRRLKPKTIDLRGPSAVPDRFTTFQAGMCMKTNNRVRSPGYGVRSRKPNSIDSSGPSTVPDRFATFQAGMCMKTKETVRSPKLKGLRSWLRLFCLLAPHSCSSKIQVQPEMLMKTNDRKKRTRGYGTRGVQIPASALQGTSASVQRGVQAPVTGYPGNMLKTKVRQNPITHHKSPIANALAPDSWLLTPALQK